RTAGPLLEREADGRRFRLIGIGAGDLTEGARADPPDLLDPQRQHEARVEAAIDAVRAKLGEAAIAKGRGLKAAERPSPAGPVKPRSR
ncbi:MAG: DNA polymerase IV, partial [Proteobacteria bacterium]|nr:DNA polymerase IV [Pseudomonadota bacterium]